NAAPRAIAAVDAALAIDPAYREAQARRVTLLRRAVRWRELAEAIGRRILVEESLARKGELYRELAEVCEVRLSDPVQAMACYRLALEADPWANETRAAL